ncbi:hypothetical protein OI70_07595 [Dickeya fangzhongdai]|uniref:DUF4286 family protein n=1 Tax=Dickeya fangzhongdai TaxID=1778540 RepID=UPI00057391A5|nr:DUF4286 family protein [Dickeya fangzhongdai]KHN58138.1 hypothetical protein OI70_07595 [Dickeya fangzhongdai]
MTAMFQGMLFVATDIDSNDEDDFNRWYDVEHVEERVRIEGFLSGSRYQSVSGGRKYLGLYKTASLASFTSSSYQAAFQHQTPWSITNLQRMRNPMRRVCSIQSVVGQGTGSQLAIITLPDGDAAVQAETMRLLGESLAKEAGFVRSSLLLPDTTLSSPLPKEATENRQLLPMLLIESNQSSACRHFIHAATAALSLPLSDAMHYALSWTLTDEDLQS